MTEKERRDGIKDGDEFGQWTVVQKGERTPEYWLCQCVCGAKREVCPRSLVRGRSTCCGPKCPAKPRKTDVVVPGAKLEKWTVLSYEGQNGPQPLWKCRCECGNERVVQIHNVLSGTSESCGECGPHRHGEGMKTPEYISWQSMHGRCRRRPHHAWDRYTSKNIKICQRWFLYVQFLEDMVAVHRRTTPWTASKTTRGTLAGSARSAGRTGGRLTAAGPRGSNSRTTGTTPSR
jgi:hypothetical protein